MEQASKQEKMPYYARIPSCSLCFNPGHNRQTCALRPMAEEYTLSPPTLSPEEKARFDAFQAEEKRRFDEFKAAQKAEEEERRRQEEAKAAHEQAARKEEQAQAVNLFKSMLEQWLKVYYDDSESVLVEKGKLVRMGNEGSIHYGGHEWIRLWRDQRYSSKGILRVNYGMTMDANPRSQGREWDGWPIKDEADEEVARIVNKEWSQWLNFCRRFADRVEPVA